MQVFLLRGFRKAKGGSQNKIDFSYISIKEGSDRSGVLETKNGKIFTIAQWHPMYVCL
jgi:hypothetical protein